MRDKDHKKGKWMMENMIRLLVKRPGCSPELTTVGEDIWAKSRAEILDGLVGGEGRALVIGNFGIVYNMAAQEEAWKLEGTSDEGTPNMRLTDDIIAPAELLIYGTVVLTRLDADREPISLMPVEDLPPELQVAFFGATSEDWVC